MIPLTIRAALATPPVGDHPILLDAVLLAGAAERYGRDAPAGWGDPEAIYALDLPLARTPEGWYAASQATPPQQEARYHLHRRGPLEDYARFTTRGSMGHKAGPDKSLRKPMQYRPEWTAIEWTCVGDPDEVPRLLRYVGSIGRVTTHGQGWVLSWTVTEGGPPLEEYSRDLTLRHLPVDASPDLPAGYVVQRQMPLSPPYWQRRRDVAVWQYRGGP